MGRIEKHILDDGFTVIYDDSISESFHKNILDDNYHGDKGSKINRHFLDDGFTVRRYDGIEESFQKNWLDDNYTGNEGTHINKNILNDNYNTYNNSKNYGTSSSSDKIDFSWMDRDQHISNIIGLGVAVLNGVIMKIIGMGLIRVISTSIIIALLVSGTFDVITDFKKKKYKDNILFEQAVGGVISAVILIPLYFLIVISFF